MTTSRKFTDDITEKDPSTWNSSANHFRNSDLELVYYGYEDCLPNKSWGPGTKGHYKVHYIKSGTGTITYKNQVITMHGGQCFVLYPDTYVYYESSAHDPLHYYWVAFDGANAKYYFQRAQITEDDLVIDVFDEPAMKAAFNKLMSINLERPSKDLEFISVLYSILSALMPEDSPQIASDVVDMDKNASYYIKKSLNCIHGHYAEDISISEIADNLAIDRKYFAKIFKEQLRMPPSTYLANFRLSQACTLLELSDLSIYEIAEKVGYDNPFSFTRAFKRVYDIAPTTYRANYKNTQ